MRFDPLLLAMTIVAGASAAAAQTNVYYAERGGWVVSSGQVACRALNRPPEEFNAVPFNALEIVVRPGSLIGVEAFFWPTLFEAGRDYELILWFDDAEPFSLAAKPTMGDFMLATEPQQSRDLWRNFQRAKWLRVRVDGLKQSELFFTLDDSDWLLSALQTCVGLLPKP